MSKVIWHKGHKSTPQNSEWIHLLHALAANKLCPVPAPDEFKHSSADMLHPHHTVAILYNRLAHPPL